MEVKPNVSTNGPGGHYHRDGQETHELQSVGGVVRCQPGNRDRCQERKELLQRDGGQAGGRPGPRHHQKGVLDMPSNVKDSAMLLTVSQAAELLQLGRDTMYQLTHIDGFPSIPMGRAVRINRAALQAWLDQNNGGILL